MAEKAKQVAIAVRRKTRPDAKIVQATGFKLRMDKLSGFVEIFFERRGAKGERISFDSMLIQSNLAMMKRYIAGS